MSGVKITVEPWTGPIEGKSHPYKRGWREGRAALRGLIGEALHELGASMERMGRIGDEDVMEDVHAPACRAHRLLEELRREVSGD